MPRREIYELEGGPHCGEVLWGPPAIEELVLDCGCEYHRGPALPGRPTQMQHAMLYVGLLNREERQAQAPRPRAPKRGSRRGRGAPERREDLDDEIPPFLGPELD